MHATTACILMCYDVKWQKMERDGNGDGGGEESHNNIS